MRSEPPLHKKPATLVVIEFSASWPRWLEPSREGDMAVVAQHYEGAPSSLVTQVATRMMRLQSLGWRLERLILVTNGRVDPDALAARSVLARGLLSRLRQLGGGELQLTVDRHQGKRAEGGLLTLGGALESSLRGAPIQLSVRVGDTVYRAREALSDSVVVGGREPTRIAG